MHPTRLIIDTSKLLQNIANIKTKIGDKTKICFPIKADAYGHGLTQIAKFTEHAVDYFAVAHLNEAIDLINANIRKPILVFGSFDDEQIASLIKYHLEITVASIAKAKALATYCQHNNKTCRVHIKIDTGMCRIGVIPQQAKELIDYIIKTPMLQLIGIYSHFAISDLPDNKFTNLQITSFKSLVTYVRYYEPNIIAHLANSGGVVHYPESYFDMVRPGILTYGYYNSDTWRRLITVEPCMSLVSKITHFKRVDSNIGISYGHNYKTMKPSNIATIAIGYGDGMRRNLSNQNQHVIIAGKKYPIVGTICMDMLMVNMGDDIAEVGDEVIIIGNSGDQNILVSEVSATLNTIDYEIITGFAKRIARIYTEHV